MNVLLVYPNPDKRNSFQCPLRGENMQIIFLRDETS